MPVAPFIIAFFSMIAVITISYGLYYFTEKKQLDKGLAEIDAVILERQLREPLKTSTQIEAEELAKKYMNEKSSGPIGIDKIKTSTKKPVEYVEEMAWNPWLQGMFLCRRPKGE